MADDLAVGIIGVGRFAQADGGYIAFIVPLQILDQARCTAQAQNQHAGCQRVERASVADLPLPDEAPHACHHIMRRHPRPFVNDQQPIGHGYARRSTPHGAVTVVVIVVVTGAIAAPDCINMPMRIRERTTNCGSVFSAMPDTFSNSLMASSARPLLS